MTATTTAPQKIMTHTPGALIEQRHQHQRARIARESERERERESARNTQAVQPAGHWPSTSRHRRRAVDPRATLTNAALQQQQ